MKEKPSPALQAIQEAQRALRQGDRRAARRWAEKALKLAPESEEPWLMLAALASPRASLIYLGKALEINPHSKRARKGIHWVIQRQRHSTTTQIFHQPVIKPPLTSDSLTIKRQAILPWAIIFALLAAALLVGFRPSSVPFNIRAKQPKIIAQIGVSKATRTPTPTATFTPTPTYTPTPTFTPSPTPTETPTPTSTATPIPTNSPEPYEPASDWPAIPEDIGKHDRWIDVNLTTQTTSAFEGKELIKSFIVSTGTWQHPTVTGQYQIYVKYSYADMAGPGYYLPDVPNVMYFYKGYGLHGTYWHNNFGTPMSHGCINLTIADSSWLFDFASVGTLVNIHY